MDIKRPLVIFDLETTGTDISKDRIVQIAWLRIGEGGVVHEEESILVNPMIPIPVSASEVHGIYDKDVENAPTFKEISDKVLKAFDGADIGGYNIIRFDIPLLAEEMLRAGKSFSVEGRNIVDSYVIYTKNNPRTLSAAYKEYTGKEADNAHDALADVHMVAEVISRQVESHKALKGSISGAAAFSSYGDKSSLCGKFINKEGEWYFNFGKHRGNPVLSHKDYLDWMLSANFPEITKAHINMMLGKDEGAITTANNDDLPF